MANVLAKLEGLATQEAKWAKNNGEWLGPSAKRALQMYEHAVSSGLLSTVQDGAAIYSRARGLVNESVLKRKRDTEDNEDEEEEEEEAADLAKKLSRGIIPGAYSPEQSLTGTVAQAPPKRKRRSIEGVSFHPDVFVRTDADIDVLRKSATFNTNPNKSAPPPCGILRTSEQTAARHPTNPPQPPPAHTKMPLSDSPSRDRRFFTRKNQRHRDYQAKWAPRAELDIIDTSWDRGVRGKNADPDHVWASGEKYYANLQVEAEQWDRMDYMDALCGDQGIPT